MAKDAYAIRVFEQAGISAYVTEIKDAEAQIRSMPQEEDAKLMFTHIYDVNTYLNCARSLEHGLVLRAVMRNSGLNGNDDSNSSVDDTLGTSLSLLPTLFKRVWKLIPTYIQAKIRQWAKSGKEAQIAREITEYVNIALSALPFPVPSIFINAVANLVVPPLATYIISWVTNTIPDVNKTAQAFGIVYTATSKSRHTLKHLDRKILCSAGLKVSDLPAHLKPNEPVVDDDGYKSYGQPDSHEAMLDVEQFYDGDFRNGCKPMPLGQIIAAQIRINPKSDVEPEKLGPKA